jgi:methylenetetrahydrofolate--tRNA-(uracil-5-)-methyltransferase
MMGASPTSSAGEGAVDRVTVVGGGLAGCEAAILLAKRGHPVRLVEMKPHRRTPAQTSDRLCELVCSNSLRSDNPSNAIGLLHEELRRCGSPVLQAADQARVPAGDALAVDRAAFSDLVEGTIAAHPLIERVSAEVTELPRDGLTVVATGPLTAPALAAELATITGERLYFYDAIAPIVAHESIDHAIAFAQSRYDKGGGDDYLNLPFTRPEYERFVAELVAGAKVAPHEFEEARYFEGCLPIEVMAERGVDVLAYGPMKPVGLTDPRTGRRPHAVVQLRREDRAGTSWNLVGFQTRLTWPEQRRIFRSCVPGLANAEFLRMGQVHRNTYVDSPRVLAADFSVRARPDVFLAGQITGVEGYVESAACGHLVACAVDARINGGDFVPPPPGTSLGALYGHVTGTVHPDDYEYQPTNVTWGLFPPLDGHVKKHDRRAKMLERARHLLGTWLEQSGRTLPQPAARVA